MSTQPLPAPTPDAVAKRPTLRLLQFEDPFLSAVPANEYVTAALNTIDEIVEPIRDTLNIVIDMTSDLSDGNNARHNRDARLAAEAVDEWATWGREVLQRAGRLAAANHTEITL